MTRMRQRACGTVGPVGEHLTGGQFAAAFSDCHREPAACRPLTFATFRAWLRTHPATDHPAAAYPREYRAGDASWPGARR